MLLDVLQVLKAVWMVDGHEICILAAKMNSCSHIVKNVIVLQDFSSPLANIFQYINTTLLRPISPRGSIEE